MKKLLFIFNPQDGEFGGKVREVDIKNQHKALEIMVKKR